MPTTYTAVRLYENGPIRFTFGNPPNLVMDYTVIPKKEPEDVTLKYKPLSIRLYTYEWIIKKYSMLHIPEGIYSSTLPVGPCDHMDFKLHLSRNGDNMTIDVYLLRELKLTEDQKVRDKKCHLISKALGKYFLNLEFLDSTGKTIEYYKSLPLEYKFLNTSRLYFWSKEENASRVMSDDTLRIRAKLSMRHYPDGEEKATKVSSTELLRDDMKSLFDDRQKFPDLLIRIGNQHILAHKSIVYTQCPGLIAMTKSDADIEEQSISHSKIPADINELLPENYDILSIPHENVDVFLCVLHFIYCRRLQTTEAIDDFEVFEFAKKYGVRELSMLMEPRVIKNCSEVRTEKLSYKWYVENFSSRCKVGSRPIESNEFKTETDVSIAWCLNLYRLESESIVVCLQGKSEFKESIKATFKLIVRTADGTTHDEKEYTHLFRKSATSISNYYPVNWNNAEHHFSFSPDLLFNDTLEVCCDLEVSTGSMNSKVEHIYSGQYRDINLEVWIDNLRGLLQNGTYSDATLNIADKEFKIHKAIISTRSQVFTRMFESDMEEKRSGYVRIEDVSSAAMEQFLLYVYTGQISFSIEHASELYRMADKYEILDLKNSCEVFIMENVDISNAVEILILADLYNDEKMKDSAKSVICRNADIALLSHQGIELMTEHPDLAQDILKSLSHAYCSLPSQDVKPQEPASPVKVKCGSLKGPVARSAACRNLVSRMRIED